MVRSFPIHRRPAKRCSLPTEVSSILGDPSGRAGDRSSRRSPVHEIDDAPPRRCVLVVYMPAQPSVMRRFGRDAHHLGEDQTRAAQCACAEVHEWNSFGVPSTERYMSIGATTMRLTSVMPRNANGVNIGGATSVSVVAGRDAAQSLSRRTIAPHRRGMPRREREGFRDSRAGCA